MSTVIETESEFHGHGYQGERLTTNPPCAPLRLSVAISRQAGSRGASIGRRVGRKLGWQVYDHEMLGFLSEDKAGTDQLTTDLPAPARQWASSEYDRLQCAGVVRGDAAFHEMVRIVLELAAQGEVIFIGRGVGHLLPAASVVHVRIVAPQHERISYLGQWLRLTDDAAQQEAHRRDGHRAEYLSRHFPNHLADECPYDVVLNSSRLSEDQCADLIVQAVRAKLASRA